MAKAKHVVLERDDYDDVRCEECGSGDRDDELLLCDKCDKGFHMKCVSPIVVRVPIGSWLCPKCCGQRRVRSKDALEFVDSPIFCEFLGVCNFRNVIVLFRFLSSFFLFRL